jgi:hypothetical protein
MIARYGFQARYGLAAGSNPAGPANLRLQRKLRHRRPACVLDQGAVVYHAAHKLLADNEIKERYCSM